MSEQHHYLPITKIQPGMILANELLDKQGQVLLPIGVVITQAILSSLLLHDVHQLSILKNELDSTTSLSEINSEETTRRLDTIFRHAPLEEPTKTLAQLIRRYRLEETR